jgi:hypothetical protein
MIRSMEGFTFASALDLNMGYYHIKVDADAQNLCTIVFPLQMENTNTSAYPLESQTEPIEAKILMETWKNLKHGEKGQLHLRQVLILDIIEL